MSILDTAKTVAAKVTGGPQPDPEVVATLDKITAQQKLCADLDAKSKRLTFELEKLEADKGKAAVAAEQSGDDSKYRKLVETIAAKLGERDRVMAAHRQARTELQEAEQTLLRLGVKERVKTISRHGNMRLKNIERMVEGIAIYADAWKRISDYNRKLGAAFGPNLPDGALLGGNEIRRAVAEELYRIHPVLPLTNGDLLPGAITNALGPSAAVMVPLAKRIEAANERLVRLIEEAAGVTKPNGEAA